MKMKVFGCSVVLLFALLLPATRAQNDCFCPGFADPPDPEQVIQLSETVSATCGKLAEEATKPYLRDAHGCNFYRYYGQLCGCEDPGEYQICSMCQDDEEPEVSAAEEEAATKTAFSTTDCQQYPLEAKFDPFVQGCGYYHYLGTLCGCANNQPPPDACTLCADGSDPTKPDLQVPLPGSTEAGTCAHVSEYTQYILRPGGRECTAYQATLGKYCGCPDSEGEGSEQPVSDCPICSAEDGLVLTNQPAPTFSYTSMNGATTITQSDRTCLEAEVIANELYYATRFGEKICTDLRQQLAQVCCTTLEEFEDLTVNALASNNSGGASGRGTFHWLFFATIAGFWQVGQLG